MPILGLKVCVELGIVKREDTFNNQAILNEFADCIVTEEDIHTNEGNGVAKHWFEQCNLPPPLDDVKDDDDVSLDSFCTFTSEDNEAI